MAGYNKENQILSSFATKAKSYFPELCSNSNVKEFLRYDGLVQRRNFTHFNTEAVKESLVWKILPCQEDSNSFIIRDILPHSSDFESSADAAIRLIQKWNNVDSTSLAKIIYVFLDKVFFIIDHINKSCKNFNCVSYPGSFILNRFFSEMFQIMF